MATPPAADRLPALRLCVLQMILADVLLEGGEEGGEKVAEVAVVDLLVVHHCHVVVGFGAQHGEVLSSMVSKDDIM